MRAGLPNLLTHVANMRDVFGLPAVVALNIFPTDTDAEIECVMAECAKVGAECIRSTVWADGSAGALELARAVKDLCEQPHEMRFAYDSAESLEDKIVAVVRKVYGGCDVEFSQKAQRSLAGAWMGIFGSARVYGKNSVQDDAGVASSSSCRTGVTWMRMERSAGCSDGVKNSSSFSRHEQTFLVS